MPPNVKDFESLTYMRQQLSKYNEIQIARHFTGDPLSNVYKKFNEDVGVCIDLEWHNNIPEGKINEIGLVVFPMSALRDCQSPADFKCHIAKFAVYHIRVLETYHMRNSGRDAYDNSFFDAEQHSIFAPTRFVPQLEVIEILQGFLDHQRCDDGTKRPVVVIGHGFRNDEENLKADWNFEIRKLEGVVYIIRSLSLLGVRAGIFSKPDKDSGERNLKFHEILVGFRFNIKELSLHNGANDAVYELVVYSLITPFPFLYPAATGPFPADSSIADKSLNELLDDLTTTKKDDLVPTWGYSMYCFYYEVGDDHNSEEKKEVCKAKIECSLCKNVPGPENAKYRSKKVRIGHSAARCTYQYRHVIPALPTWVTESLTDLNDQRAFARAVATRDEHTMAGLIFDKIEVEPEGAGG
jgi:hypothetical protein